LASPYVFAQQAQVAACGVLAPPGQYGPYDYRNDRDKLPIVDNSHFTPEIEALIPRGNNPVGADIDYTLRAFPNHHRALLATVRLGEKLKSPQPYGLRWTIDCYFDRAIRFRPDDAIVRMIFAKYLNKRSRRPEALQQLSQAVRLAADGGFTHYNAGLIYLEMQEYDLAVAEAHKALSLGFERPELRDRLMAAGKWKEPPPAPESAASQSKQ